MPVLAFIGSFLSSSFGQIVLVGIAAFAFGYHQSSVACRNRADAERVAWVKAETAEIARQAKAVDNISRNDRVRADEAIARADEMQKIINELANRKGDENEADRPRVAACPTGVDERDFARRVRLIDEAAKRRR